MTASDWKARARGQAEEQAVDLELPSGMVIRARRPGAVQFAAWDRLPLMLANAELNGPAPSTGQAKEIAQYLRELLIWCCVAPRVSETPGEDQISPRDIPEADWQFIVGWAMRAKEAAALRPFRGGGKADGDSGHGKVIRMSAEPAHGDRGPGTGAGAGPGGVPESHGV